MVDEDGEEVLEHFGKRGRCLITGDNRWTDYQVEAEVRQMSERCSTNSDDAFRIAGKTGIVLRQQDVRRYYLLCIDALNKLILYRREDDIYYPFAFQVGVFCTHRY